MIRLSKIALPLIVGLVFAGGIGSACAQEQTVRVGMVRELASTGTMIAIEKGYFKDYGIKVVTEDIDSSIDALAIVAQNRRRSWRAASRPPISTPSRRTCRSPLRSIG